MDMENEILTGSVIGDEGVLALEELARACGAEAEWIVELVAVGVLEPQGTGGLALAISRGGSHLCPTSRPAAEGFRGDHRGGCGDDRSASADRSVTRSPEAGRPGCGLGAGRRGRPGPGLVRQPVSRVAAGACAGT